MQLLLRAVLNGCICYYYKFVSGIEALPKRSWQAIMETLSDGCGLGGKSFQPIAAEEQIELKAGG